jgi:fatty acid desaturase
LIRLAISTTLPPRKVPKTQEESMDAAVEKPQGRRIAWLNLVTVLSAAVLIGAEVFGAAFAAGWAFANLLELGPYGVHILQGVFFLCGLAVMARFIMNARRVEPFTER